MAIIMFDDMTTLDFAGFHNAVTWLKKRGYREDLSWHFCASKPEVTDDRAMVIKADAVLPDLSVYDLVFVPGGAGTRTIIHDAAFMEWIDSASQTTFKISVCTGALIYGEAGFLEGKTITTNPLAYSLLEPYCKEVARRRVVRDGSLFTGGGITASVDLGLFFVEAIAGRAITQEIQTYMDYPYYEADATHTANQA